MKSSFLFFALGVSCSLAACSGSSPGGGDASTPGPACGSFDLEPYRGTSCFCGAACECFLDVPYGPATWTEGGEAAAQVLDFYRPVGSSGALPIVFWAHPNGSTKHIGASGPVAQDVALPLLAEGVAFASLEFRHPFVNASIGAPRTDVADAIQFLRCQAAPFAIDGERMAAIARSRGTLAIWTAVQDDMADASSADPARRMSTRLRGVYGIQAQSSYWGTWIADTFFSAASRPLVLAELGTENYGHAVGDVTADDPPVAAAYATPLETLPVDAADCQSAGLGGNVDCVHLPNFGDELCKAYTAAGIGARCQSSYSVPSGQLYSRALPLLRAWIAP